MVAIPPLEATINLKDKAKAMPYKYASSKLEVVATNGFVNQVVEQANCTNLFLQIVGSQLS